LSRVIIAFLVPKYFKLQKKCKCFIGLWAYDAVLSNVQFTHFVEKIDSYYFKNKNILALPDKGRYVCALSSFYFILTILWYTNMLKVGQIYN